MIHDVALQGLPVVICVDRAGFNSSDGTTHHGVFDVAFTSQIPGFKIYSPVTYESLKQCLNEALNGNGPSIIRYPSGCESESIKKAFYSECESKKIGVRCDFNTDNKPNNLIITHGRIVKEALAAQSILKASGIDAGIVLCEHLAPYNDLADDVGKIIADSEVRNLVFLEEEIFEGGFGMLLSAALNKNGMMKNIPYEILAAANPFASRKEGDSYLEVMGLDGASVADRFKQLINRQKENNEL
jgi:1-deoxy-D-xylulose-5-phosphate synthase